MSDLQPLVPLLEAFAESMRRGGHQEMFSMAQRAVVSINDGIKARTELAIAISERLESERYANWLKTMFVEPQIKAMAKYNAETMKVLQIVRDTSIKPDDKLAQIEELLTWDPEDDE